MELFVNIYTKSSLIITHKTIHLNSRLFIRREIFCKYSLLSENHDAKGNNKLVSIWKYYFLEIYYDPVFNCLLKKQSLWNRAN